jgi:hypothetical protein
LDIFLPHQFPDDFSHASLRKYVNPLTENQVFNSVLKPLAHLPDKHLKSGVLDKMKFLKVDWIGKHLPQFIAHARMANQPDIYAPIPE